MEVWINSGGHLLFKENQREYYSIGYHIMKNKIGNKRFKITGEKLRRLGFTSLPKYPASFTPIYYSKPEKEGYLMFSEVRFLVNQVAYILTR